MRRTSVRTERNFSPARNVLSITLPSEARRSLVRTNAAPLPGFTCWNSSTLKTVPSTSMWLPFFSWLVLITQARLATACAAAPGRASVPSAAEAVDAVADRLVLDDLREPHDGHGVVHRDL